MLSLCHWWATAIADAQIATNDLKSTMRSLLCLLLVGATSAKLAPASTTQLHKPTALSKVHQGGATKKRPASEQLTPSEKLCGNQPVGRVHDNSSLSHFAATTQPC